MRVRRGRTSQGATTAWGAGLGTGLGTGCELTSEHTKADPMAPLPYSGEFADKRAVIFERGEEPGVGATGNPGSPLFPTDWRFGCGATGLRACGDWDWVRRVFGTAGRDACRYEEGERERERLGERERSAEPPASVPVGIGATPARPAGRDACRYTDLTNALVAKNYRGTGIFSGERGGRGEAVAQSEGGRVDFADWAFSRCSAKRWANSGCWWMRFFVSPMSVERSYRAGLAG